jgi:hypothetical protein
LASIFNGYKKPYQEQHQENTLSSPDKPEELNEYEKMQLIYLICPRNSEVGSSTCTLVGRLRKRHRAKSLSFS